MAPWSLEQRDLIERFETAYNRLDEQLRRGARTDGKAPFHAILADAEHRKVIRPADRDFLKVVAELRNVIVHGKRQSYGPPALPAMGLVNELEKLSHRLERPKLAIPTFQKSVDSVTHQDSLAVVLKLIRTKDFSQLPVYRNGKFIGLLTENGITRWLADHVTIQATIVDLDDQPVAAALREEEHGKQNHAFAARSRTVPEIRDMFRSRELIEAVLITERGSASETLLGIATRWDIVQLGAD